MAASQFPSPAPTAVIDFLPSATISARRSETAASRNLLGVSLNAAERGVDFLAIVAAAYCCYALYRRTGAGSQLQYPPSALLLLAAAFALLFVILLERHGGYRPYVSLLAVRDTERILRVTVESFLLALLVAYFTAEHVSRLVVVLALVTVPVFATCAKWEMH